jgi:predicted nucleotide-binding protein
VARNVPPAQRPKLTVDERIHVIARLNKRIAELEAFNPSTVAQRFSVPEVMALETSIGETLEAAFGHNTPEYYRYAGAASLDHGPVTMRSGFERGMRREDMPEVFQGFLREGKDQAIALLKQAVRGLEEELPPPAEQPARAAAPISKKVFVVHGHDNETKIEVARFLGKIGLDEIILHERPHGGRHLLTKFQEESEGASFAVILITPDDEGGMVGGPQRKRARQNVIFELGFFIGRLGPARVSALVKGDVETPSDFDGIGYIQLDSNGGWKGLLARELSHAKVPFDPAKVFEA